MTVRVGIVTFDYTPAKGGQGRFTQALVQELQKRPEVELKVFSPDVTVHPGHIPSGRLAAAFGKHLAFSLVASKMLSKWQCENGIELFHLNGGPGGVLLVGNPDVTVMYTAHHTYLQQARYVPGQSWKRWLIAAEEAGYRRSRAIAAVSKATASAVVEELKTDIPPMEVIPNGVDSAIFKPLEVEKVPDSVLFVGRLDERKGAARLLRSWHRVLEIRPSAKLFLIGEGQQRRRLEGYSRKHSLDASVSFLGRVPVNSLVEWYNRAWCVAIPSAFEGFGLSALEAIACGTPVVATATEGLSEVVRPGIDGLLVEPWDEVALASAICEALAGPGMLDHSVVAGVLHRHDWSDIAESYAGMYVRAA
jgi:glycosyltransferase involved in cell wall biosynthesis